MESEDSSDDNDESHLYSLIHYSVDDAQEEIGTSAKQIPSESSIPLYQSKYSKVSRWDAVKLITDTNNELKLSETQKQEREPVNNYRSLLNAYKAAKTAQICNWSNRERNFNNLNKQNFQQKKTASIPLNLENNTNKCKTLSENSKSSVTHGEKIALNYQSPLRFNTHTTISGVNKNVMQSETKEIELQNVDMEKSKGGGSGTDNKTVGPPKNKKKNAKNRKANKKNSKNVSNDEVESSKYNLVLCKDKQNGSDESVIILDDSESEPESVVEVVPPAREPPPLVSLSSDEDIVILCEGANDYKQPSSGIGSNSKEVAKIESSCLGVLQNGNCATKERAVKKKRKKKKKKNENKNKKKNRESSSISVQRTPNSKQNLSALSPSTWTKVMSRFYNESWGGENFDCRQLQKNMTGNRFKWQVSYADVVGHPWTMGPDRTKKCTTCNVRGHSVYNCPFPPKPTVCLFCGITGHSKFKCPAPICLTCGRPAGAYKECCSNCLSTNNSKYCNVCNGVDHLGADCPETWRRYHATTSNMTSPSGSSTPQFKPQTEQFCCNCARKGHHYNECRQFSKQPNKSILISDKRPRSPYEQNNYFAKRRKFNNGGFCFPEVNSFFRPHYTEF
ncbi:zinc finger CCHC domain-containing protein 7-like isoform X2 [Periplaneta americana]